MLTTKIKRNIEFLRNGKYIPADNGNSMDVKPVWFDERKYNRAKEIVMENIVSIFLSHLAGLILIFLYTPLVEPFLFTGESSSLPALRRRYLLTCKHVLKWYAGDIWNPKDSAYKSILTVRNMHKNVAIQMDSPTSSLKAPEGMLFFSQAGMLATQFAFIGWLTCFPKEVGLYCDKDDLECILHFWRCIGYLLGMDDKYNICDGNYEETVVLFKEIIEEEIKIGMRNPRKEGLKMSKDIVTALSTVIPLLSWNALKKYWFENIDFPVDFTLNFYDIVCFWFYKLLCKIILRFSQTMKLTNYLFKCYIKKFNVINF
ncbi:uncharacterized protein LOC111629520 [Centruroides sculpturatus]|uniref:uncharacterized protein LOC111629520 n=1 Tax=Centruroides sculpturatus TaxID=218467 RepID=UPI000C6CEA60|nr:uncharacterized protein LOC111629520 [Centruroides sculpturatus]